MKKVSLLLAALFGATALVACNSGGGSSGGGGGDVPSGCPNGASQCGASTVATQYDTQFPNGTNGSLVTASNVIIGNGESVALTFGVKNITTPVTVSFTSNGGNLQSTPSYTFGDNESSYTVVLQTNNGATSYNITPSVNATNMTPVTVNTISTSMFQLPLGTYKDTSTYINTIDCTSFNAQTFNMTIVNTMSGFYQCVSYLGQSFCDIGKDSQLNPINSRFGTLQLPSAADPFGTDGYYFNGAWNNGVFSLAYVYGGKCSGAMQSMSWQYQSSSTVLPYPLLPDPTPFLAKLSLSGVNLTK